METSKLLQQGATMEDLVVYYRETYKEVYLSELNGQQYIWRALKQKEYRQIVEFSQSEEEAFERVCQVAILYPEYNYIDGSLAYLPETIGTFILDKSGYGKFSKEFDILNEYRLDMEKFDKQAEVLINRAFPYITFDMMADWTKTTLLEYLAKAEWSLRYIDGFEHVRLLSEEEQYEQMLANLSEEEREAIEAPASTKTEDELLMESAKNIRARGGDALLELYPIFKKPKEDYLSLPMIGGSTQTLGIIQGVESWKEGIIDGNRYESIRESVQEISRRRR